MNQYFIGTRGPEDWDHAKWHGHTFQEQSPATLQTANLVKGPITKSKFSDTKKTKPTKRIQINGGATSLKQKYV